MGDILNIILGAGITGLAGLIGLLVNHSREHRVWLRDEKLKIYTSLLGTVKRLDAEITRASVSGHGTEDLPVQESVDQILDPYFALLAPAPITDAKNDVYKCLGDHLDALKSIDEPSGDKAYGEADAATNRAVAKLQLLMRDDLGATDGARTLRLKGRVLKRIARHPRSRPQQGR